MTKKEIIKQIAEDLLQGVNEGRTKERKLKTTQTLTNFGILGLHTTEELVESIYNGIVKLQKKK